MGIDVALFRVTQRGTSPRRRKLELLDVYVDQNEEYSRACAGSYLRMLTRAKPHDSLVMLSEEMEQVSRRIVNAIARWVSTAVT